jgi:hypothetical protein
MPAPSLELLFAYEHAIESAWQTVLREAGILAFIEASDLEKTTPFVDVQLRDSLPQGQQFIYQNAVVYYNAWQGTLSLRIVTQRGKNSDLQAQLIGKTRIEAQSFPVRFTTENLPYHEIQNLREIGIERGIITEQRLDWAELQFKIFFGIRNDAWPL